LGAATTIVKAKVFDGTMAQDWTSVRFADGLITECSVASAAHEGDEVIDADGGTALPGLIDAHVHEAQQLDAFDARLAKVVAAARARWSP
jgi:imidazolonepropionase-like amidohydrolase